MVLRNISYLVLLVGVLVSYLFVHQNQSAPVIKYSNLSSNYFSKQAGKFRSLFNRSRNIVDRFRCLKEWKQFGDSCYHPSIMKSKLDRANQTCHLLGVNHTHLMRIRHPVELSYAAHIFFTKNLTGLIFEVDAHVFNGKTFMNMISESDRAQWQITESTLSHVRRKFKPKPKSFRLTTTDEKKNDRVKNGSIPSFDEDNNIERFDTLRHHCDQFIWDVFNNDSHIFTFSTYKYSGKLVCLLSNAIDLNSTHEYLCQYILNFCFGNILCGKHGRCVNSLEGFTCACSLFFDGARCKKFAHRVLQMLIAGIILFILYAILLIRWGIKWNRKRREKKKEAKRMKKQTQPITTTPPGFKWEPSEEEKKRKRKSSIRSILLVLLFLVCFCSMLAVTIVVQSHPYSSSDIDPSNSQSVIAKTLSVLKKCERTSFFPMDNRIFLGISITLTIMFFGLAATMKQNSTNDQPSPTHETNGSQLQPNSSSKTNRRKSWNCLRSSNKKPKVSEEIPMLPLQQADGAAQSPVSARIEGQSVRTPQSHTTVPFHPQKSLYELFSLAELYQKISRYETAAIFGILTFEILKVFDEILLAISGSSSDGVLLIFVKRIFIVFLIGCRYYPLLISLHLYRETKSIQIGIIQFLTFVYVTGIIVYTVYREGVCLDFLPRSGNFSAQNEVEFGINLNRRLIIYGFIANMPHFALLSYIMVEFGMRLGFDLPFGYQKGSEAKNLKKSSEQSESSGNDRTAQRSKLRRFRDFIYKWDSEFLYSTMILSTYTVNFIILFHFTCTFSFLYTTGTASPIAFLTKMVEQILNIEIQDQLLRAEVLISAIITAFIYGIQLFFGMKKYREDIRDNRRKGLKIMIEERGISKRHARSKAIQYPGYLIRYTLGGFVITFHLLIFITFIPRLLWYHYYAFGWIIEIILPLLISYALQSLFAKLSSQWVDTHDQVNTESDNNTQRQSTQTTPANKPQWKDKLKINLKNILQYFILVANCFIGILSSIFRLILVLVLHIIFINRIDICLFQESQEKFDSANRAYWCFVYQEISSSVPESPPTRMPPGDEGSASKSPLDDQTGEGSTVKKPKTIAPTPSEIDAEILPLRDELANSSNEDADDTDREKEETAPSTTNTYHGLNVNQLNFLYNCKNLRKSPTNVSASSTPTQQLRALGLIKKKIEKDGNCFFRAISYQLNGHQDDHPIIRADAVNYLTSYNEDFKPFMDTDEYPTMEEYIQEMGDETTFADHLAILATAIVKNKNIIIHEIGQKPLRIPGSDNIDNQVHILYHPNIEHYDSVVCLDGNRAPFLPLELMQRT